MTLASEYSFVFTKFLLRSELLLAMIYKNNNQGVGLGLQLLQQTDMMVARQLLSTDWLPLARKDGMMEQRTKSFPVSWEELHRTSKALAWRLLELGPFKGLIAVTRGGLVPAAIVARELEIRLIDTACIASYNGSERGMLDILKPSDIAADGKGWLLVMILLIRVKLQKL